MVVPYDTTTYLQNRIQSPPVRISRSAPGKGMLAADFGQHRERGVLALDPRPRALSSKRECPISQSLNFLWDGPPSEKGRLLMSVSSVASGTSLSGLLQTLQSQSPQQASTAGRASDGDTAAQEAAEGTSTKQAETSNGGYAPHSAGLVNKLA